MVPYRSTKALGAWWACTWQIGTAALLIPLLALAPRSSGALLLVPLMPRRAAAAMAVERGALIVADGPMRGSLIVRGRVGALAWPLLRNGILTLAAPASICGAAS